MKRTRANEGFILVMALLIVGVVAVMVAGSLVLSITNQRISSNDAVTSQVVNIAQAGNAYYKAEFVSLYKHMVNNFEDYEDDIQAYIDAGGVVSCGNYFAIGVDLDRDGTIDYAVDEQLPSLTIPLGSMSGTVDVTFSVSGSAVRLEAYGQYGDANATIIDEFNISNIDIWNNAVFAESGAANATIQGRAEIRGAVHLLGQGASPTDTVLDLSGDFGMGNTYRGLNPSLNVNASEMRLTHPDPLDLCATLRVRSGKVDLTGSGSIGYDESTNPAEDIVDNLHGIYTNDGIDGGVENSNVFSKNGMEAKYDAGDSFKFPKLDQEAYPGGPSYRDQLVANSLVLSLNGSANDDRNKFDISKTTKLINGVSFSSSGQIVDSKDGLTYELNCVGNPFGVTPGGLRAAAPPSLDAVMASGILEPSLRLVGAVSPLAAQLVVPLLGTLATHKGTHGNGSGGGGTGVGGAPLTTAKEFVLKHHANGATSAGTADFHCIKYRYDNAVPKVMTELKWERSSNTLYVGGETGVVTLLGGDLFITGGNGQREIGYKGNGVIFAEEASGAGGNIIVEIDFLPAGGERPIVSNDFRLTTLSPPSDSNPNNNDTYPASSLLGMVARNTFVSQGAQNRFTLAIYAEDSVEITQQTLVAGAVVTQNFNAGSQVPTVLYVPNLSERLSSFMPGAGGTGFAVSNVAWSRSF